MPPLLSSQDTKGQSCLVCGSPDRACGGHPDNPEPIPVDAPRVRPHGPATALARAKVNGVDTIFKTTPEEAAANGWVLLGTEPDAEPEPVTPAEAEHEARSEVSARNTKRPVAQNEKRTLAEVPMRALRRQATQLGIATQGLDRSALVAAIQAQLPEPAG